jgi:inorganic pyrophosphatase/exopolyphosphatase
MDSIFEFGMAKQNTVAYAFIDRIHLSSVESMYYPSDLEQQMLELKQQARYIDIVFSRTDIFNKE